VAGLGRIGSLLQSLEVKDAASTRQFMPLAGEALRMLSQLAEPWDDGTLSCTNSEVQAQEEFFFLLSGVLQSTLPTSDSPNEATMAEPACNGRLLILLMRLLQFILAFAHTWSQQSRRLLRSLAKRMTQSLFVSGFW
jgi:hypothetical protein